MNIGKPDCERYQKVFHALWTGPKTTFQLMHLTHDCSVGTTISEMKRVGYPIGPAEYRGKNDNGRKIYLYSLEGIRNG